MAPPAAAAWRCRRSSQKSSGSSWSPRSNKSPTWRAGRQAGKQAPGWCGCAVRIAAAGKEREAGLQRQHSAPAHVRSWRRKVQQRHQNGCSACRCRRTWTTVVVPPAQRSCPSIRPAKRKAHLALPKSPCRSPTATRRDTAGNASGGGCGGAASGCACGGRGAAGPCACSASTKACTKPAHSCRQAGGCDVVGAE